MRRHIFLIALVLQWPLRIVSAEAASEVPFVGCRASVQGELRNAPQGQTKALTAPADLAKHLAFYASEYEPGVLGPRGWNCIAVAGTNGQTLYVTPAKLDPALLYSETWKGLIGPAIQLSVSLGDTSGRFHVAQMVARVFPKHKDFVQQVIKEGLMAANQLPSGPFPKDHLHYVNDHIVEYTTPSASEGLGTRTHMQASDLAIEGVVMFDQRAPRLVELAVRLPPDLMHLRQLLVRQIEHDGLMHP